MFLYHSLQIMSKRERERNRFTYQIAKIDYLDFMTMLLLPQICVYESKACIKKDSFSSGFSLKIYKQSRKIERLYMIVCLGPVWCELEVNPLLGQNTLLQLQQYLFIYIDRETNHFGVIATH